MKNQGSNIDLIIEITNYLRLGNVHHYHKSLYSENVKRFKYIGWNGFFDLKTGLPALFLKIRKNDDLTSVAIEGIAWKLLLTRNGQLHVLAKKGDDYEVLHLKIQQNPFHAHLISYKGNGDIVNIHQDNILYNMFLFIQQNYWYE